MDLKYEIAKLYGIGLTVDQVAFLCETSVEEISEAVTNDIELQKAMAIRKREFEENERLRKEKRKRNRSKPEQKKKACEYEKQKAKDNPQFRLKRNFSANLRVRLKGNKTNSIFETLGYSLEDLYKHLESQFIKGMTWDNYGSEWHIDHKIPDSWFSYSTMECEGFKNSWALSNLQPLWKSENLSKNNRYASI